MPVCQHGTTAEQAFDLIIRKLTELGYAKHVKWTGHNALVSVGFGKIIHIKGRITSTEILVEFGGVFGGKALTECRKIVGDIFPGSQLI